jgi:hypothetical protein
MRNSGRNCWQNFLRRIERSRCSEIKFRRPKITILDPALLFRNFPEDPQNENHQNDGNGNNGTSFKTRVARHRYRVNAAAGYVNHLMAFRTFVNAYRVNTQSAAANRAVKFDRVGHRSMFAGA